VSLQVKRLEEVLGRKVIERTSRSLALTPAGATLLDCARRMLELNDESVRRVCEPAVEGRLRLGITEYFVLVEILWSAGRSVKVKRKLLDDLVARLANAGLDPENVMVVFKETAWENWAFAGGRLLHG
jgi:DNA-binding transcriptional LysR family regulator